MHVRRRFFVIFVTELEAVAVVLVTVGVPVSAGVAVGALVDAGDDCATGVEDCGSGLLLLMNRYTLVEAKSTTSIDKTRMIQRCHLRESSPLNFSLGPPP